MNAFRAVGCGLLTALLAGGALSIGGRQESAEPETFPIEAGNILPPAQETPDSLRIVSFNVHLGENLEELARLMQESDALCSAGIFLLQEIESFPEEKISRTRKLAERLGLNFLYAPARQQERDGKIGTHGLAILSRYPLSDAQVIPLPHFELRRRIALAARASLPGGEIQLYNVHLDTRLNSSQRLEQLQPVVEAAKESRAPVVIVGGDFNTNPFRWLGSTIPWFRSNQSKAVDEVFKRAGFLSPLREAGSTSRRGLLRMRLDSIYSRGAEIQGSGIERDVDVSDHYPLWIDLAWPPAPAKKAAEAPATGPPD